MSRPAGKGGKSPREEPADPGVYAVPVSEAPESERPVEPPAEMAATSAQATDKGTIAAGRRRARQRDQAATPVPEPERLPPRIQIDIDPAITAGLIHDRYDLLIRGRVVASTPIDEAALLLMAQLSDAYSTAWRTLPHRPFFPTAPAQRSTCSISICR